MVGLLVCILFGVIVGWIGAIIAGMATEPAIATYLMVSVIGAVIGDFIGQALSQTGPQGFNLYELTFAIICAIIGVVMLGFFRRGLRSY